MSPLVRGAIAALRTSPLMAPQGLRLSRMEKAIA